MARKYFSLLTSLATRSYKRVRLSRASDMRLSSACCASSASTSASSFSTCDSGNLLWLGQKWWAALKDWITCAGSASRVSKQKQIASQPLCSSLVQGEHGDTSVACTRVEAFHNTVCISPALDMTCAVSCMSSSRALTFAACCLFCKPWLRVLSSAWTASCAANSLSCVHEARVVTCASCQQCRPQACQPGVKVPSA